jgi:hypothetical protein
MRFNHKTSLYISAAVFALLLLTGFLLSRHKTVWSDEFFTQRATIDTRSYADILLLRFPEGNKCPLFYIIQKFTSNLFSYKLPVSRIQGLYAISDPRSQVIMRIPSNIYMSLALAGMFYFFTRFFSLFTAVFALCTALVSPMVWQYWVEARPYSLWFLLTTVQLLLYSSSVLSPQIKTNKPIYWVHFLLILTTPGSIFQILIISILLLFKKGYKKQQLIWTLLLPMGIFLFYYFQVPAFKVKTFFLYTILFKAVMPERLVVYGIYACSAWVISVKRKESSGNTFFLPIFLLFLLSGYLLLLQHVFVNDFQFGFFNRYLIYLVPADILMFSLVSHDLCQWSRKNSWVCMNVGIFLGGLVIVRGLITYRDIWASALYLHSGS